jgi:hypothetical protein
MDSVQPGQANVHQVHHEIRVKARVFHNRKDGKHNICSLVLLVTYETQGLEFTIYYCNIKLLY